MNEILRLAKIYYKTCMDVRYFGWIGLIFILTGSPFLIGSAYISIEFRNGFFAKDLIVFVIQFIGLACWRQAMKKYDKNLVIKLKQLTLRESDSLKTLKLFYLSSLTNHIGKNIYEVLKNCNDLVNIYNKNRTLSPGNIFYHFSTFVYNPDAKNRILSLFIYLLSLVALLVAVRPSTTQDVFTLIDTFSLHAVSTFLFTSFVLILLFYFIFMLPFSMAIGYIISPLMRTFSNEQFLINYFMAELSKNAFSDVNGKQ